MNNIVWYWTPSKSSTTISIPLVVANRITEVCICECIGIQHILQTKDSYCYLVCLILIYRVPIKWKEGIKNVDMVTLPLWTKAKTCYHWTNRKALIPVLVHCIDISDQGHTSRMECLRFRVIAQLGINNETAFGSRARARCATVLWVSG